MAPENQSTMGFLGLAASLHRYGYVVQAIEANKFIDATGIDALAVCIGNVHGSTPPVVQIIDLICSRYDLSSKRGFHLVLHGASGLPKELVEECIKLGVREFNANTEVQKAYRDSLISSTMEDLIYAMAATKEAMKAVVAEKMQLFASAGKAL